MTTTIDWGGDIADLSDGDLDPSARDLDGSDITVMLQSLFRRFTTDTGSLFYDATYGLALRALLSEASTPEGNQRLQAQLVAQALLDERIDSANATVDYNASTESAVVTMNCFSGQGPFSLVLSIDKVSVVILNNQAA